jgi:hypothetical protein
VLNSSEGSEIVKRPLSQVFGQHSEQDHRSVQMADHFALRREYLFANL